MSTDATVMIIYVLTGAFGSGYFIYGKRTSGMMLMLCGAGLCAYPYFTDNLWALIGIGITLLILPYFLRF